MNEQRIRVMQFAGSPQQVRTHIMRETDQSLLSWSEYAIAREKIEEAKKEFMKEYLTEEEREEIERGKFTEIPDHDCGLEFGNGESGCDCSFMREGD